MRIYSFKTLTLLFLLNFTFLAPAMAEIERPDLVQKFLSAFWSKNESAIVKAYAALKQNPNVIIFMQNNLPNEYSLLNAYELTLRVKEMQERHGVLVAGRKPLDFETLIDTQQPNTQLRGGRSNRTTAITSSNQRQPNNNKLLSNEKLVKSSNGDIVRNFSNQDRARNSSNQKILRNGR